jgi:HNH endonuclease
MAKKVALKNAEGKFAVLDDSVYKDLKEDESLKKLGFIDNLRMHSSGCVVFQKAVKNDKGKSAVLTIYLHKIIAEKYLANQKEGKRKLVGAINGDKLDCRLENLHYRTRALASRLRKTHNETGYTGVYKEHKKYRAVISIAGKSKHLGMFLTADEAATAYNDASAKFLGEEGKINVIKKSK